MNSEGGRGVSSVLERVGVCQLSRCCGACVKMRLGCARQLPDKRPFAARPTIAPSIDDPARSVLVEVLTGRRQEWTHEKV
jgi:hypothetical protein